MPKIKYITEQEYEIALNKYYNGLVYDDHIQYNEKEIEEYTHNINLVKEHLLEGEEYEETRKGYVLTSYGRLYNLRHRRFLRASFYKTNVYAYCKGENLNLKKVFKLYDWHFDKVEILKRYLKYDWNRHVFESCDYLHLAQ
tara:strand:+ start:152 stop:574 length:423 start_codon:yes stop_codon:yes gene_type:complete